MANLQDIINRSEVGAIKPWTKATAPDGYLLCNGGAVSRTTYADLFAVISTTYGSGDGSTTFNVPQLQGKMPQGYDGNTYNLAGTGGANTVTVAVTNNQAATNATNQTVSITGSIDNTSLTTAQLASHRHDASVASPQQVNPGPARSIKNTSIDVGQMNYGNPDRFNELEGIRAVDGGSMVKNAGSGTGHNHSHTLSGTLTGNITTSLTGTVTAAGTNSFSPFVVVNYIIKH
jgi:microcystin-dependent protein